MSSTKQIEMAHVVQALESVRGAPVLTSNQCHDLAMALRPILGQPSEQRQGEPVAMPDRKPWNGLLATADNLRGEGWNACLDEIAKLGPLYTHSDAGEVERLKQELLVARAQGRAEVVEQILQLDAETGLYDFIDIHQIGCTGEWGSHWKEIELQRHFDVDPQAAGELARCRHSSYEILLLEEERDSLRAKLAKYETALKFYADRDHFSEDMRGDWDSVSGEPHNILWHEEEPWFVENGSIARHALSESAEQSAPVALCSTCKGYGKYQDGDSGTDEDGRCPNVVECECDDSERMPKYRKSAPVERDERAEFEKWYAEDVGPSANLFRDMSGAYKEDDAMSAWDGWMARANLERKP